MKLSINVTTTSSTPSSRFAAAPARRATPRRRPPLPRSAPGGAYEEIAGPVAERKAEHIGRPPCRREIEAAFGCADIEISPAQERLKPPGARPISSSGVAAVRVAAIRRSPPNASGRHQPIDRERVAPRRRQHDAPSATAFSAATAKGATTNWHARHSDGSGAHHLPPSGRASAGPRSRRSPRRATIAR